MTSLRASRIQHCELSPGSRSHRAALVLRQICLGSRALQQNVRVRYVHADVNAALIFLTYAISKTFQLEWHSVKRAYAGKAHKFVTVKQMSDNAYPVSNRIHVPKRVTASLTLT